jgi:nucleotide-binding universal stress UspA family protein
VSPYQFDNVLVAIDGSDGAQRALDCAISLSECLGGRLTGLVVEGRLPAYAATAGEVEEVKREKDNFFQRVLEDARRQAAERGVELETDLVPGHAAEMITHYARAHGHDLIVIGHRGHFLGDYLLGSTADRVAHHAHCPVIVVRYTPRSCSHALARPSSPTARPSPCARFARAPSARGPRGKRFGARPPPRAARRRSCRRRAARDPCRSRRR